MTVSSGEKNEIPDVGTDQLERSSPDSGRLASEVLAGQESMPSN
jgi:hypothetical protein